MKMDKNNIFEDSPSSSGKMRKWYVWIFIVLLAALILWTVASDKIASLFNSLLAGLTPVIIAMVISYLFLKPMNLIENKLMKNAFVGSANASKYKRAISLSILYIVTLGLLITLIAIAVPSIISMVEQFTNPTQLNNLLEQLKVFVIQVVQVFGITGENATGIANTVISAIEQFVSNLAGSINIENVFGIAQTIFSFFMGFLISFFLLKDKELIAKTGRRYTYAYYPRRKAEEVLTITRRTKDMMDQYVVSTLIVCFTVFVIAIIGYAIMGVPYAFMMALILGILTIIPYIGGFIAAVPLLMVTLLDGNMNLFLMAFVFTVAEWALVTTFMPAFIMSKRMNTRTLIILLALIIGGAMFGIVGMIISAPIASVLSIVMNEKLKAREALREHEELIEAGIIDENFYDISEMLDLTQDNPGDVAIEKEEDDFKKLQALKNKSPKITIDNDQNLDIVLASKSSKKKKVDKNALARSSKVKDNQEELEKISQKINSKKSADEILEETE